ncbi:MAG: SUMF1/EgtB/PvdO family nonheme iron enzyme [Candidatus Aminicenantes bacterium]|nr:SUMF1/EgtB/PvdO family nonheme iron enzyme [Candidatus Aminicenantes bacterium]
MEKRKIFSVFIASPSDVPDERTIAKEVCSSINKNPLITEDYKCAFKPVGWEEVLPSPGIPQETINEEVKKSDVLVCIFYKKYGKGTLKEFLLAYDLWKQWKKPHILFYFKKISTDSLSISDLKNPDLNKVLELKQKLMDGKKLLFKEFSTPTEFRELLENHLQQWLVKQPSDKKSTPLITHKTKKRLSLTIPAIYQNWIIDRCQYMDIDRLREKSRVISVSLPETFIPLYTQKPGAPKPEDKTPSMELEDKQTQQDIEDLLVQKETLLIEGEAGSGKTTLLKHIAWQCIQEKQWKGLKDYLPVLISLKDIQNLSLNWDNLTANAKTAEKILNSYFKTTDNGLNLDTVKVFCEAEKILFLIDGLDEINPSQKRDFFIHSLADFRLANRSFKIALCGRPHGIDETAVNRFGKNRAKILPLNSGQVRDFIHRWFEFVFSQDSRIGSQAAQKMISDIEAHPGTGKLKDNPLMLTAICILYLDERELPGQRAELYNKFIWNLLYRRFTDPESVYEFLTKLARRMHTVGTRGIDYEKAIDVLTTVYPQPKNETESVFRKKMKQKFDEIEPKSGLLKYEDGLCMFRHLTFQEFLTAAAIMDSETNYSEAIESFLDNDRYQEVIELFAGLLSIKNRNWANTVVNNILDKKDDVPFKRRRLAARSLLDMHETRRNPSVVEVAQKRLMETFATKIPPRERAEAGETVGWLEDPRNLEEFVPIEGGTYIIGKEKHEIKPFEITKFPVTNSWFSKFWKAGGYKEIKYWSEEGKTWLDEAKVEYPRYWYERQWNCPNAPLVGVSWYEAEAFTNWLTSTRKGGYIYKLPDELQWEAAAGGKEGREYPWGPKWLENICNTRETEIMRTSAVGIFPQSNTPETVSDMAGNVWEWTDSLYDEDKDWRVVRGGSWYDFRGLARCAVRGGDDPRDRDFIIGFRCVRTKK